MLLPVGDLALFAAVGDGLALAKLEVAGDGANLTPGWFPDQNLVEQVSDVGRRA